MDTKTKMCIILHLLITCATFGTGISGVCLSLQSFWCAVTSLSCHIDGSQPGQLALPQKVQVSCLLTCHFATSHMSKLRCK